MNTNQADFIKTAGRFCDFFFTLFTNPTDLWNVHANMLNVFMCAFVGGVYQGVNQEKNSGTTLTWIMTLYL